MSKRARNRAGRRRERNHPLNQIPLVDFKKAYGIPKNPQPGTWIRMGPHLEAQAPKEGWPCPT